MIRYWMLAGRQLLLFGLLPMLAGSAIAMQGWMRSQAAARFAENLRTVEGRVLRIEPESDGLAVDVAYLNEAGVRYEKRFKADARQEGDLRAVGKVSVIYDLRYPEISEMGDVVSANNRRLLYGGMTAAGVLLWLAGFIVIGNRVKETAGRLWLLRTGRLVRTEIRDSALAAGGETGRFVYAFLGPDGRWYEGKSPQMRAKRLAEWGVGRRILVAYDPSNPRRSEADLFGVVNGKRRDAILTA